MLLAVAVLIAGCGGPAIAPSPCPASVRAAAPPPGEYLDSQAVIDYDALVPPGDPRRNVDMAYARQVIADPMLLEQIYHDATHGNQRAAWLVCELEATALSGGRGVARHLGSLRCKALGTCRAHWDALPISRDTASGQRLLSVLAAGFREEARRQALEDEIIANALMVLVGARIAARTRLGAAPASAPNVQATRAGTEGLQVGRFRLTKTVARHATEVVKRGPFKGKLARPFLKSPHTIEEIMATGKGVPDPSGVAGALRWDVPGTFRGTRGTWELVVKDELILHFNFVAK